MSEIVREGDKKGIVVVAGGGMPVAALREVIAEVSEQIKDEIQIVEDGIREAEDWMFFETEEDKRTIAWLEDNVRRGKSVVIVGEERSGKVHLLKRLLRQRERTDKGFTLVEDVTPDSLKEMKEELEEQQLIIGKAVGFLGTINSQNVNAALSNMWWSCSGERHDMSYSNLFMDTIDIAVMVDKGSIVGVFHVRMLGGNWAAKDIPGLPDVVDVVPHPVQDPDALSLIKSFVQARKSVVIVGEGSAKFGFMNKLFTYIPASERVTIWDNGDVLSSLSEAVYTPNFDEYTIKGNRLEIRDKVTDSCMPKQRTVFGELDERTTSAAILAWSIGLGIYKGVALLSGSMSGQEAIQRIEELTGHTEEGSQSNNLLTYAVDLIVVMDGDKIIEVSEVLLTNKKDGALKVDQLYVAQE
ncbi:P-loop NTPase family protein [Bacillus sp. NEAU-Y102]